MTKKGERKVHVVHHANQESHETSETLERTLIKNLVELQKVHTDLAEKFDKLAHEISQILSLFELTARSFAKNIPAVDIEKDREFLEKIDKLLEQNKVLAKGITLMEERLREKMYSVAPQPQSQQSQTREAEKKTTQENEQGEFQPSIASSNRPLPRF